MPHAVNRNAFLAAKGCGHLLLSAYGLLVAAELALKDHYRVWNKKHDIPQMLDDLADPGLTALGAALRTSLGAIPCTHVDGNQASIPGNNYPHLRATLPVERRTSIFRNLCRLLTTSLSGSERKEWQYDWETTT